jgi:hypothetical protein
MPLAALKLNDALPRFVDRGRDIFAVARGVTLGEERIREKRKKVTLAALLLVD